MTGVHGSTAEPVDELDRAYRFTAPNPGPKTLEGTNSYVVGGEQAYVIDPGPDDDRHLYALTEWLRATDRTVLGILLTHGHPDHALGATPLARMLHVPVWAAETERYPLYAVEDHLTLRPDSTFEVAGDLLQVVATPGHTPDSVSYLLASTGIIFTGDTILGRGSSIVAPPEGDMSSYMSSLEALRGLNATRIAPGHGPIVDRAEAKIQEYIDHRRSRETQLASALADGPSSIAALVVRLYVDTPTELHELAAGSVQAGLQKLEREGKVRRTGGMWSLVSSRQ